MLLQERIEELDSAIIDTYNNIIKLHGFMSKERLLDYYDDGTDCRFSSGVYPNQDFNIAYIKDNGLFVILEDGKEIIRYSFLPIKRGVMNYRDIEGKNKSKLFTIRKCSYTHKYNYKDVENSLIFDSETSIKNYLFIEYNYILEL